MELSRFSRRTWFTAALGLIGAGASGALGFTVRGRLLGPRPPSPAKNDVERRVLQVIDEYDRTQRSGSLSVSYEDGRLLRILAESLVATRVVEIGTSFGYSGLWLAIALGASGRLTTFEIDEGRHGRARANFERAGVLDSIDLVLGDAHLLAARVEGPVDMVFCDADKAGYLDYLRQLTPALRPGGLFVSHNIQMATREFHEAISSDAALETTFVDVGSGGIAVTLKKRG
jgi:predicted O-methyltransferase YrrM